MAEAMQAGGIGPSIEFHGEHYAIKPWTLEMTCFFEAWLERKAWDALERMRPYTPEPIFNQRTDRLMAQIAAGMYSYGSEIAAAAAQSLEGRKYCMFLQLSAAEHEKKEADPAYIPKVTEELVSQIWTEGIAEEIEKKQRAQADPTVPAETPGENSSTPPKS